MGTTTNSIEEQSLIDVLIRPAILRLISESEGGYRRERDLHHHLTVCLAQVTNLELGTPRRRVRMEEPALACYGSGRKGNLDCFFPSNRSVVFGCAPEGVAVELNYNYDSCLKIKQDVQKLIDPDSAFGSSLYFAYGRKRNFHQSVIYGIERAFEYFAEAKPDFQLPSGLHFIIVELLRSGEHDTYESSVNSPCVPAELTWVHARVPAVLMPPNQPNSEPIQSEAEVTVEEEVRYLNLETAKVVLQTELAKAGIPLISKTARCMFEPTLDSHGQKRCKFGATPLWGNEVDVVNGRVLYSEFMDWVQRLCDSGHAFQRAGRASWA